MAQETAAAANRFGKARRLFDSEYSGFYAGQPGRSRSELIDAVETGYVELVGATRLQAAEVHGHGGLMAAPTVPQGAEPPVYEYSWAVGVTGYQPEWSERLDEKDAVVVQLIFRVGASRYSVQEIAATLKQVPPYQPDPKTTAQGIQDWLELLRPLVDTTGKVVQLSGFGLPGKIISAVSEMKFNSVPVDKFPWFVKTFSTGTDAGIEWHIPRSLIFSTGNRLVGSLGVSFLDCEVPDAEPDSEASIELRAFLRSKDGDELFISPTNEITKLDLRAV